MIHIQCRIWDRKSPQIIESRKSSVATISPEFQDEYELEYILTFDNGSSTFLIVSLVFLPTLPKSRILQYSPEILKVFNHYSNLLKIRAPHPIIQFFSGQKDQLSSISGESDVLLTGTPDRGNSPASFSEKNNKDSLSEFPSKRANGVVDNH